MSDPKETVILTAGSSDLLGRTLSSLLAGDLATGLALGSILRLLRLLDRGSSLLLLLALLDGSETGGAAGLGAHGSALLDHLEGGTDDRSLGLDGTAGALLGSFLSDTLAVLATEENSPGDAARVLSLQEQRLGLAILESEDLAVATDVKLTLSRVDPLAGESIVVRPHCGG